MMMINNKVDFSAAQGAKCRPFKNITKQDKTKQTKESLTFPLQPLGFKSLALTHKTVLAISFLSPTEAVGQVALRERRAHIGTWQYGIP